MRRAAWWVVGIVLAVTASAAGLPGSAQAASGERTTMCGHNQHRLVHDPAARYYQVRNPYWRGRRPMCIKPTGGSGFRVTSTTGPDHGHVTAYPDILRGCIWNICTPNSPIPVRVSHIRQAGSTWHTREGAKGTWNASYDIWFGTHRMERGHADGAELMIWLNHHGRCCALQPGARKVRVDGRRFRLSHWQTYDPDFDVSWHYVQFRFLRPRWRVDHLRLLPFIRRCERMGLIRRSWWMENVEAGFEIWKGGLGLSTTKFRVTVRRTDRARNTARSAG